MSRTASKSSGRAGRISTVPPSISRAYDPFLMLSPEHRGKPRKQYRPTARPARWHTRGVPDPDLSAAAHALGEAAEVVAFWRDLGLPGLVDIHTHFMPPNVLAKVWAFFEGGHAGVGRAWPIAYRRPEEERVALLRAFGVHRFSALLYPH